ncbi:alpha/beta fold hydrolase [Streptomyces auratus]|uniref:Hydrolase n=1 Tax=Streptomyces auratus AGR0001 TaxID=1160718 RepID=J2JQ01_9ACTN|nr:alpha/beta fold hydrolase [Streptomyces auratus]QTZ95436.1 alpha/beta fold hydrolase [Streptomyces auratus AGR0001]
MADSIAAEQVRQLSYQGYEFACRILECPAPVTEPIVVMCAAFQNIRSYHRYDKYWRDSATIICMEPPGSYSPDPVPRTVGYDFDAGALAYLLDELDLPRINLLGISLGAAPTHRFAQEYPERIARLMLTGAALGDTARRGAVELEHWLRLRRADAFGRKMVELCVNGDPTRTVRNRVAVRRALLDHLSTASEAELVRYLAVAQRLVDHPATLPGRISGIPALCVTGEHDELAPPDLTRTMAAGIDGAAFTTMRETCHVSFLERHADWADLVLRFFTDQPLAGLDYLTGLEHPAGCPEHDESASSVW